MRIAFTIILILTLFSLPSYGQNNKEVLVDIYLKHKGSYPESTLIEISDGWVKLKDRYGSSPKIPIDHIAQIVFPGGQKGDKGIVLKSANLSGTVKEFRNREWRFELPFGELFIRKPGEILSINLIDTIPDTKTQSDGRLSVNVLEWIYDHNLFRKEGNWNLDIKKAMISENMIVLTANIYSSDSNIINSQGCYLSCMSTDNGGRDYDAIWTALFKVPPKIEKKELLIRCPMPSESATSVILKLKTGPEQISGNHIQYLIKNNNLIYIKQNKLDLCSDNDWHALPAIAMPLLRQE